MAVAFAVLLVCGALVGAASGAPLSLVAPDPQTALQLPASTGASATAATGASGVPQQGSCLAAISTGQQCGGNWSSVAHSCLQFSTPLASACDNTAWPGACCPAAAPCQQLANNLCWVCGGAAATPAWLSAPPQPGLCTTRAADGDFDYACVLGASSLFYEAQRSGKLPPDNRIPWRGDSSLNDTAPNGAALVNGWYDAGDTNKFTFPLAWTVGVLSLGLLEFSEGYQRAGQVEATMANIRWAADYLVSARYAPDAYVMASVKGFDTIAESHRWWGRPEEVTRPDTVLTIRQGQGGGDLLAAAAAALAAASTVWQTADPVYSDLLLGTARDLYESAITDPGKHTDIAPEVKTYYASNSVWDDMCLAAAWLAKRTGEEGYLAEAKRHFDQHISMEGGGEMRRFNYDNQVQACGFLLARLDPSQAEPYSAPIRSVMDKWLDGESSITYTEDGMAHIDTWANLGYVTAQAFMGLLHNQLFPDKTQRAQVYTCFARKQLRVILGDSTNGRSYVAGVGNKPPCQVHHRGASCGPLGRPCDCAAHDNPACNPNVLWGALLGGPGMDGSFDDKRAMFMQSEAAVNYNAGFSGVLAELITDPVSWKQCQELGLQNGRGKAPPELNAAALPRPLGAAGVAMAASATLLALWLAGP